MVNETNCHSKYSGAWEQCTADGTPHSVLTPFLCLMLPCVTEDVLIRRVKTTYSNLRQLARVFLGQTCDFTIHYELLYYVSHFGLMTLSHSNKFIFIKSFELKALCTFHQAFDYYLFTCITLVDWVGRFYYYKAFSLLSDRVRSNFWWNAHMQSMLSYPTIFLTATLHIVFVVKISSSVNVSNQILQLIVFVQIFSFH